MAGAGRAREGTDCLRRQVGPARVRPTRAARLHGRGRGCRCRPRVLRPPIVGRAGRQGRPSLRLAAADARRCKRFPLSARIRNVSTVTETPQARADTVGSGAACAALDSLYVRYHQTAVRRCARRTGDVDLAEDAVQEGFIQVLQRLRSGDDDLLDPNPEGVVQRNARWAASKLMARDRSVTQKARMLDDPSLSRSDDPW